MFKLLGHALGHSFGLVVIVVANTVALSFGTGEAMFWVDIVYTGGYTLVPLMYLFNVIAEGRVKRKQIKMNMNSEEYLKEFHYNTSKKTQKKLDKIAIKNAKRGK